MKKRNLSKLALMGISLALLTTACNKASADEEMTGEMKTFYEQLTPDAQRKFRELDAEHKRAALKVLELGCRGESQCKGHRERAVEEQYKNQTRERSQKSEKLKPST